MNYLSAVCTGARLSVLLCLLFLGTFSAKAGPTTYTYTGPTLTTNNGFPGCSNGATCNITGSFTFVNALPANSPLTFLDPNPGFGLLSYSFTDGNTVFDQNTPNILDFSVGTDSSGHIDQWSIILAVGVLPSDTLLCVSFPVRDCGFTISDGPAFDETFVVGANGVLDFDAFNGDQAGSWMGGGLPPTPTPEPGAFSLLLIGSTLLLGAAGFRKMTHAPAVG